jgi:hypothetical protein
MEQKGRDEKMWKKGRGRRKKRRWRKRAWRRGDGEGVEGRR